MLKTRARKIFRDIISRKGRTLLVVMSILIGVFGVTVMFSMADLIIGQLRADLKPEQISHNHIYVVSPGETISPEQNQAFLDQLGQLPNVVDIEGQAVYPVYWQQTPTNDPTDYNSGYMVAFTESFGQVNLEPVARVTKGRYPAPDVHEIAVEQRFANAHNIGIGDSLSFRPLSSDTGPVASWTIVGLVLHPYFTISPALMSDIPPENAIYANYNDAQQIVGFPGLSAIQVRYTSYEAAQAGNDALQAALTSETPYVAVFSFIDDPNNNFLLKVVSQVTDVFAALGVVAMVVSGFLVTNVINTIVLEQKVQIGVMKSLGATMWDLFAIYAGMALVYGAIGTILGIAIAVPVGGWMARELAFSAFTYIDGIKISPFGIMVGAVMGLLVPVLSAVVPIFNGTRVTILTAMTDLGIDSNWGQTRMSRWIARLSLPHTVRQALSNVWQKKSRLALTGLALTLAVAAFMGTTAIVTSLRDVIDSAYNAFNYEIGLSPLYPEDSARLTALIKEKMPEIEGVYLGIVMSVGLEGFESTNNLGSGSQASILGFNPTEKAIHFDLIEGIGWQDDPNRQGVVISRVIADQLGKGTGDTVMLTYGGQSKSYSIIGVNNYPFDQIYMNWRDLAVFTGYTNAQEEPMPSYLYVNLAGKPDAGAVEKELATMTDILNASGLQATLVNEIQRQDDEVQGLNVFGIMFNTMSAVMAAVGTIGLLAALSMAVYERQREIGVMRSIGAGSLSIMTHFLVEGVLVGVIAWIAAAPLGYVLGYGLNEVLPFTYVTYTYAPSLLMMGLIGVIILATVASLWPSLAASRKTVSNILRYQ